MLNPQGGVIDDLIVYFMSEDWFRLVVNAATREKDVAWITEQAKAFDVVVRERPEFGMVAVQGPTARERVIGLLREEDRVQVSKLLRFSARQAQTADGVEVFVARTGYTGEDGFEVDRARGAPSRSGMRCWTRA
jgi:aminomethyltransferase